MKKIIMLVMAIMMISGIAIAADLPSATIAPDLTLGLANMKAGSYYDVRHKQILAGVQTSVVDYKRLVSLDIGVITDAHKTPWLIGIGVDATTLAKLLKLNYNLPGDLHLGCYVARDLTMSWKDGGEWGYSVLVLF